MRYFELVEYSTKNISEPKMKKLLNHPRFKAWFKDSKVVDNDGNPLVCHHATNTDFKLFKPFSHFGTEKASNDLIKLKTDNPENWRTHLVFLSIQQPMIIPDIDVHSYQAYAALLTGQNEEFSDEYKIFEPKVLPKITFTGEDNTNVDAKMSILQKSLLKKGIDGFRYKNLGEDYGKESWIILKPTQAMPIFKLLKMID